MRKNEEKNVSVRVRNACKQVQVPAELRLQEERQKKALRAFEAK